MRNRSDLALALAGLTLILAACSAPAPKRVIQSESAASVTTIRLAYPSQYAAFVDPLMEGFQKAHPEYLIEPVILESDRESLLASLYRDGDADLIVQNANPPWSVIPASVTDLTPYISKSNLNLDAYQLDRSSFYVDGKVYALPIVAWPRVLLGNKDLFAKAGVPLPGASWTWDEFRLAAQKLTNAGAKQWGIDSGSLELLTQLQLMQYKEGTPARLADDQAWSDALKFWTTIVLTDKSAQPVPRTPGQGPLQRPLNLEAYGRGEAAMALGYVGAEPDFDQVILPLPTLPGKKPALYSWFYSLAIPATNEKPDAAWEFIKWAAGPEGGLALGKQNQLPMYMTPAIEEAWLGQQPKGAEAILRTRWMSHFAPPGEIRLNSLMDEAINKALSGSEPWEKVAADHADVMKMYRTK